MNSSLLYLYKQTAKNRIKKALKRPVTYFAIVGIGLYAVMIINVFGDMANDFGLNTGQDIATILSMLMFFLVPADFISYAKRKGLLFRPSDTHFVFVAPERPKSVILYAGVKSFFMTIFAGTLLTIFGIVYFAIAPWKMLLYFLFMVVLENILEGCIMVICYSNETIPDRFFRILTWVLYAIMAVFVGVAVYLLCTRGTSFSIIVEYLNLPVIQLLPFIGWEVGIIHLLLVGPTVVNVTAMVLFLVSVVALFIYAKKAKCTGEYYEDAAKFAEDYAVRVQKSKKGEAVILNKKKYVKKDVKVEYKGIYAKAIYYRQLLEYKKNRFFIFGWNSLMFLGIGVIIAVVAAFNNLEAEPMKVFIVPGVVAYAIFIFSGYITKWSKELENPYTYLIPDSSLKKMWYATKIEHIRAIIDACLITIPGAVIMQISPVYVVLTILLYVCLNANKLYMNMFSDAILGRMFGNVGKQILRMVFQGLAMLFALIAALALGVAVSIPAGFTGMIAVTLVLTLAGAIGASTAFTKMEVSD